MGRSTRTYGAGALVVAGVLAMGTAACSSDDVAGAIADAAGDAAGVDVDTDGDGVSVQDDQGNGFSMQAGGEVPAEVSDVVPVPDGFTAEGTTETTIDEGVSHMVQGTIASDDPGAVMDEIESALAAEGFETLTNSDIGGEMYSLLMSKEGVAQVTVAIIDDGDAGEPAEMTITVMRPTG